jgi:hypothetical protein
MKRGICHFGKIRDYGWEGVSFGFGVHTFSDQLNGEGGRSSSGAKAVKC